VKENIETGLRRKREEDGMKTKGQTKGQVKRDTLCRLFWGGGGGGVWGGFFEKGVGGGVWVGGGGRGGGGVGFVWVV